MTDVGDKHASMVPGRGVGANFLRGISEQYFSEMVVITLGWEFLGTCWLYILNQYFGEVFVIIYRADFFFSLFL